MTSEHGVERDSEWTPFRVKVILNGLCPVNNLPSAVTLKPRDLKERVGFAEEVL